MLEKYKEDIYKCAQCGVCRAKYTKEVRYVCPVREHTGGFEHYFARGRILIARGILEGELNYSKRLAEAIYTCTMCGNCTQQCGAKNLETGEPLFEPDKITEAMRADILTHHPELVKKEYWTLLNSTKDFGNPWMQPRAARRKWVKGLNARDITKEKAEILFFAGCTASLDPKLQPLVIATFKIFEKAEVDFGILGEKEGCCGSVQRRVGDLSLFERLAKENIRQFNELGIKIVVTSCAGCYRTFKKEYPELGNLNFEVLHSSEYIERLLKEGRIKFTEEINMRVTYHDPCHLGRHVGVYDPPRNVLKAIPGINLLEMYPNKSNSWCCGGGGGVRTAVPGLASDIALDKLNYATEVGAEAIVTTCPFCESNIRLTIEKEESKLKIFDLTEMVAKAMGL
ncbi:MAG: Fe-S oxidoreductase [Deltaproteobacteria bacterium]|nr:MAG: Fe-S oxidoreductase [Deltaproteobacteria bacterium]